MFADPHLPR